MAKIQYIGSSSIEYDSPASRYVTAPPPPKKADPALTVLLVVGIGGVVIAVVALLLAIVALQERKDVRLLLNDVYEANFRHAGNYMARFLSSDASSHFDEAVKSFYEQYLQGFVTERKMLDFTNLLWETALEKEITRASIVALLRVAQNMTPAVPPEIERAISYFNEASDAEVLMGAGAEEGEEGGLGVLFPVAPAEKIPGKMPEEEYQKE